MDPHDELAQLRHQVEELDRLIAQRSQDWPDVTMQRNVGDIRANQARCDASLAQFQAPGYLPPAVPVMGSTRYGRSQCDPPQSERQRDAFAEARDFMRRR